MRLYLFLFILLPLIGQAQATLIPITNGEKWGYCDAKMKVIIPFQYDQAYPFYEDRALVVNYDYDTKPEESFVKAAFINSKGVVVFKLNSAPQAMPATCFQDGLAIVENYNQPQEGSYSISVVNKFGRELQRVENASFDTDYTFFIENAKPFDEYGIFAATDYENGNTILIFKDSSIAPIHTKYIAVKGFHKGYSIATLEYDDATNSYPTALIDTSGKEVILAGAFDLVYDYDNQNIYEDGLLCFSKDEKFGFVNLAGEVVIAAEFDLATPFSEGMAVVGKAYRADGTDGDRDYYKYGYINPKGELVIDYQYTYASPFSEGLAEVVLVDPSQGRSKILFIDKVGKQKLAFDAFEEALTYDMAYPFDATTYQHGFINGIAILYNKGKVGFINKKGEQIIPPFYPGLFRMGPSVVVQSFDNGLTRLTHPDAYLFCEPYIDSNGTQYYQPQKAILPVQNKVVRIYSEPDFNKALDTLDRKVPVLLVKTIPKKVKRSKQKGQWVELKEYYKEDSFYAFSEDLNTRSVLTTAKQGTRLYSRPDPKSEALSEPFAPNVILFLHEQENSKNVGKDLWLQVYYYEMNTTYGIKSGYVKGTDVKLQ